MVTIQDCVRGSAIAWEIFAFCLRRYRFGGYMATWPPGTTRKTLPTMGRLQASHENRAIVVAMFRKLIRIGFRKPTIEASVGQE